ncbi:MAG TPA: hypothetical protein DDX39_07445 [Bacteroidales bacterium]|nr:hypothetical protein [Bacteroidales bacterium]
MIKRLVVFFLIISLGASSKVMAQDPEFSQFYANLLYLNPAFAGSVKCPRLALSYRNQFPKLGSVYVTPSFSYDQHFDFLQGGVGLMVYNDIQGNGAINTINVSGIYSYTLNISRTFAIKGGFQATYLQKKLGDEFTFPDQIHPLYGPVFPTQEDYVSTDFKKSLFDVTAGFVGFSKDYFFGISVAHLTQPSESFREASDAYLPRKYTVHFGTTIPISNRNFKRGELSISPNFLFQQQEDMQQINYGLYLSRTSIVFGMWLRQNFKAHFDSYIMMIGYIQSKMKFAYSYDLTISKLKNQTLGAHEVSVSFQLNCKQKKKKFRTISCPSF